MIPVMDSSLVLLFLAVAVVLFILDCVRLTVLSPLRGIPGPFLARVTGLYRLSLVSSGNAPENYRKLHDRHGKILRTAPNHVSIADASAIPIIYGLGSKFLKVSQPSSTFCELLQIADIFLLYASAFLQRQRNGQHVYGSRSTISQSLENTSSAIVLHDEYPEL